LRLGQAGRAAPLRVLRGRREGDDLGNHQPALHPAFFAKHAASSLRSWSDHELEEKGRLTQPLRWDAASDTYVPVDWGETFSAIGRELRNLDPKSVVFYSLSRASLEAFYMYALFAHRYGNNNLPDSFNHDRWRRATSNGWPIKSEPSYAALTYPR
jgi:anaerobic selenocysteine-containing dehydrogenase